MNFFNLIFIKEIEIIDGNLIHFHGGKAKFNINGLVATEIEIMGSCVGPRQPIKNMIDFCHKNDVYPIVEEYPFEKMPEAFEKLEHGAPFFRCVVNMKDYAEKHGLKK